MKFRYYFWRILGIALLVLFSIVFFKIVIYVAISGVLFLIGYPITQKINKIKLGKIAIPSSISSLLTLLILVTFLLFLFKMIFPPLLKQAELLSELNFNDVLHNILLQFPSFNELIKSLGNENDFKNALLTELESLLNVANFSNAVNNFLDYAGTIIGGVLCVMFITFFFLKDEQIIKNALLVLFPKKSEGVVLAILSSTKAMLGKYFAGLFTDMIIVGTIAGTSLWLFGIQNALIIGFTAGILNIVPYIGSAITMVVAIFLGVSGCIANEQYELIGTIITKIFFTLFSINLIDGFIIQPFIFSSSVKAHPLEIFLVTIMGAILGGIGGMIIALPVYTIIRIIAKQYLSHFRFFEKITSKLNDESNKIRP